MEEESKVATILNAGVHAYEKVYLEYPDGQGFISGKIVGADFEKDKIQIEINIDAQYVKRLDKDVLLIC